MSNQSLPKLLDKAKGKFLTGEFSDSLKSDAFKLAKLITPTHPDRYHTIQAAAFVAEIFDYFGMYYEALKVASSAADVEREMRDIINNHPSPPEPRLLREMVKLSLITTNAKYYRRHNYDEALKKFAWLDQVVREKLIPNGFNAWGTRAKIAYFIGRCWRQKGAYHLAEIHFNRAITCYYERLEESRKTLADAPDLLKLETDFTNYRLAIINGLGLGWLRYNYGSLYTAMDTITTARCFLSGSKDTLNIAYCDLLLGCIKRNLAGSDPEQLGNAISLIERAQQEFQKHNHTFFQSRCHYELAVAHFYLQDEMNAHKQLSKVDEFALSTGDARWEAQSLILKSRISARTGDLSDAENFATQAIEKSEAHQPVKIDALIIRAEAFIQIGKHKEAGKDLKLAQNLNEGISGGTFLSLQVPRQTNPRNEALITLNLAHLAFKEKEMASARMHYERWLEEFEPVIDHGGIRELAQSIALKIKQANRKFYIAPPDPNNDKTWKRLRYDRNKNRLKLFLLSEVRKLTDNKTTQADILNIARPQIYKWEELEEQMKRRNSIKI